MLRKKAALIGVPMDLGANRRGVDMGPSAIRVTGLAARLEKLGWDVADKWDVDVPIPEEIHIGEKDKKYAEDIRKVCAALHEVVRKVLSEGRLPVVLGGDHSIAMGSIAGVADHYAQSGKKVGVIWVDAHGDMNTPWSTLSGNVHGMPLSNLLGMWSYDGSKGRAWIDARSTAIVGVRDLDEREKGLIRESGVRVFTMKDIDRSGMAPVMEEALKLSTAGTAGVHVSFDIDAVDPSVAPGVGTPKRGGLNYREAHLCLELAADTGKLVGLDMVEVNPILDTRNATADLACELILSGLGKSIF